MYAFLLSFYELNWCVSSQIIEAALWHSRHNGYSPIPL